MESVSGTLKGDFVDMDVKFFRVTKDADPKITFLAAFTIAGYNNHEAEGFREQEALNAGEAPRKTRARRRKDTLCNILGTPRGSVLTLHRLSTRLSPTAGQSLQHARPAALLPSSTRLSGASWPLGLLERPPAPGCR